MTTETGRGAFHGSAAIKAAYLTRVRHAEQAGNIVQDLYWQDGKGCAVGVMIHGDDHQALAAALNVPRAVIDLLPQLHDGLAAAAARRFPARFLEAIPVGADLSLVVPRLMHWLLVDPEGGMIRFARPDGAAAIWRVADLYARRIAGNEPTRQEWSDAAAAYAAAYDAAAAYAAADAACAAAYAAYVADAAAADAYDDDAYDDARQRQIERTVERLLTLLADSPVVVAERDAPAMVAAR